MTLAITGGTGFVGRALIDAALAAGHEVRALARRPQPAREGVEWVAGDLSDGEALAAMMRGAAAVIHVAGVVNAPDAQGFDEGNVAGTLAVVEAARAEGVQRLVFVSSLAAREPELSAYGASKAKAEKLVRASGLDWTIVRPPAIYGPRDREMLELFKAAKWGVVPVPREGRVSVIHVEDLARLLLALVPGGERISARTLEPDDGTRSGWSHDELALAIGWAVGRPVRVIGLSRSALMRAAKLDRLLRGRRAKLTPDRAAYFGHPDWTASAGAAVPRELWRPRIATRDGLRKTADWYRREGWL